MRRDDSLRQQILERLHGFTPWSLGDATHRRAAVALAVADAGLGPGVSGLPRHAEWSDEAALILTRRPSTMRNHAGQWALPGGRLDADETPEAAALRELAEEVDLRLGADCILGRLDDFVTRSGYAITPIVVWAGAARDLTPNPGEVETIHRIPVEELMRDDAPLLDTIVESPNPVLRMPIGDQWIAAPTAALLYQFRELCIAGRATRVAHFEQPLFAWR